MTIDRLNGGPGRRTSDSHGQRIAIAGLWDRWRSADKSETKETFTILTTQASRFAAQFHERMPLILEWNVVPWSRRFLFQATSEGGVSEAPNSASCWARMRVNLPILVSLRRP